MIQSLRVGSKRVQLSISLLNRDYHTFMRHTSSPHTVKQLPIYSPPPTASRAVPPPPPLPRICRCCRFSRAMWMAMSGLMPLTPGGVRWCAACWHTSSCNHLLDSAQEVGGVVGLGGGWGECRILCSHLQCSSHRGGAGCAACWPTSSCSHPQASAWEVHTKRGPLMQERG